MLNSSVSRKKIPDSVKGTLLVVIAGAFWGVMGIFVRALGSMGLDSMQIVVLRVVFTALMLSVVLFFYDRSLFRIKLRDIWCFLGTGFISIVVFTYCYFKTMTLTSLSVAAVLLYTAPVMVMLMSVIFFRERLTGRKITACLLALVGCIFVTGVLGDGAALTGEGIALGLVAALGYALYSIFGRVALDRGYSPLTLTLYTFLFATLGVLPLADLPALARAAAETPALLPTGALMALVSAVIPYVTYTTGLTYIESSRASIIASVEPVVATLTGIIVFREQPTVSATLGIIFVLASLVILNLNPHVHKAKEKDSRAES